MTKKIFSRSGNWEVKCLPEDGARLSSLKYQGYELLTTAPGSFISPVQDYGEFENRPVYGYDDCFPTVDECKFPLNGFICRDHGQICWEHWNVEVLTGKLICWVETDKPPVKFSRILEFSQDSILWQFEVGNKSGNALPFLHIMHPLMQLNEINKVEVPEFGSIHDENSQTQLPYNKSETVSQLLNSIPEGNYKMILLRDIKKGTFQIVFNNDRILEISFDRELFPSLGIWWNNSAYPDQKGIRRIECAFEPIPGSCSNLEKSYKDGFSLQVPAGQVISWNVRWTMIR